LPFLAKISNFNRFLYIHRVNFYKNFLTLSKVIKNYKNICAAFDDECAAAHEFYKCGTENAPVVVGKIINNNKGNATIVTILNLPK